MNLPLERPTRPGSVVRVPINRFRGEKLSETDDEIATEEPLEIRIYYFEKEQKHKSISITMRTPGNDFELAAGFLFTEGIVRSKDEIDRISYCVDVPDEQMFNVVNVYLTPHVAFDTEKLTRNFYTTSSCGVCGKASIDALRVQGITQLSQVGLTCTEEVIRSIPAKLRKAQTIFSRTGGLHASGLFNSQGELIVLREDVGRHNALDKIVGSQFLQGILPLNERILAVSGRTSFEIIQKAAMPGIPFTIGVGAPSSLAAQTAREFGMTLVGFAGPDGFNIYSGKERVLIPPRHLSTR